MEITDQTLDKIVDLAKLHLEQEEREILKGEIETILEFMGKLQELDTNGIEPLIHLSETENPMRTDVKYSPSTNIETLPHTIKKQNETFFKVPKVVKKGKESF